MSFSNTFSEKLWTYVAFREDRYNELKTPLFNDLWSKKYFVSKIIKLYEQLKYSFKT